MFVGSSYSVPLHEGRQFSGDYWGPSPIIVAQDARELTSNLLVAGRHYFIPSLLGIPSPWPILLRSLAPAFSLFPTLLVPSLFVCLWRLLHGRPGAASVPARVFVSWLRGHYGRGRRRRGRCAFGPSYRCRRSAVGPAREPLTLPLLPATTQTIWFSPAVGPCHRSESL